MFVLSWIYVNVNVNVIWIICVFFIFKLNIRSLRLCMLCVCVCTVPHNYFPYIPVLFFCHAYTLFFQFYTMLFHTYSISNEHMLCIYVNVWNVHYVCIFFVILFLCFISIFFVLLLLLSNICTPKETCKLPLCVAVMRCLLCLYTHVCMRYPLAKQH